MTPLALFCAQMAPTLTRTEQKQPTTKSYIPEKSEYDTLHQRLETASYYYTQQQYLLELTAIEQHAHLTGLAKQFREKYYQYTTPLQASDAFTRFLDELRKHIQSFYKLNEGETSYILRKTVKPDLQQPQNIDPRKLNTVLLDAQNEQRIIDMYHKLDTDHDYAQALEKITDGIEEEIIQQHLFEYYEKTLNSSQDDVQTAKIKLLNECIPTDLSEIERIYIGLELSTKFENEYNPAFLYLVIANGTRYLYSKKTNAVLAKKIITKG